ncbi:hypothetical protein QBC41DRAFT_309757 [Cercophora samala]|uniref:Secreted protein n=1 Tax=Cercophora samala TaxID=330535 RepID=A0AA40DGI2_9PEZI|nr:hypothetical protein QBC41DRAFT_309757 [Cercophora samala]
MIVMALPFVVAPWLTMASPSPDYGVGWLRPSSISISTQFQCGMLDLPNWTTSRALVSVAVQKGWPVLAIMRRVAAGFPKPQRGLLNASLRRTNLFTFSNRPSPMTPWFYTFCASRATLAGETSSAS